VFLGIFEPARLRQSISFMWVSAPINTNHFVVLGRDPSGQDGDGSIDLKEAKL
jgi:hypothetical protein